MTCNTAVFYDVENLISLFNVKGNKTLQLGEIHRRILDIEVVEGISVQKAYADWALQVNRNLRSYVLQIGIEPVQIFNTNQNDKVKNAADVSLIIDAVELIAKRPEIENYVIASGDGIFAFLAKKLHEYGKRVIGCGFDRNTNITFKNACDIFIALEKTDAALTAVVKNFNKGTIAAPSQDAPANNAAEAEHPVIPPAYVPPSPPAAELRIPNKLPKNKFSEALIGSDIPIWKNARDLSGSLHVIKRMINVLFELADTDSDLEISLFKAYLDYYLPNFRMRQYGFKRFGEFMRFLITASPYCLIVSEGTVLRIARRDAALGKNDALMDDLPHLTFIYNDGSTAKSLFDIEEGTSFTFNLESKPLLESKQTEDKDIKTESARKWIKNTFLRLSKENKLTAKEIKQLLTEDYAKKTFGTKAPAFKVLNTKTPLRDQRMVDGKIKYWKDNFKFNGKSYLIFKEWTDKQHRAKFEAWLKGIETR